MTPSGDFLAIFAQVWYFIGIHFSHLLDKQIISNHLMVFSNCTNVHTPSTWELQIKFHFRLSKSSKVVSYWYLTMKDWYRLHVTRFGIVVIKLSNESKVDLKHTDRPWCKTLKREESTSIKNKNGVWLIQDEQNIGKFTMYCFVHTLNIE